MRRGQLLSELPSLRRYASFLTGSDDEGDALVTVMLQGVLSEDIELSTEVELRLALLRALHDVWNPERGASLQTTGVSRRTNADFRNVVSPTERAMLIMTRLEGFFVSEASYALRLDEADAARRLDQAERKLEHQIVRRILIVEDNLLLGMELEEIIASLGHDPIGPATTSVQAVDLAMRNKPHLILSDVQLGDGTSGIDAIDHIRHDIDVPVIYVTAFPNRLQDRRHERDSYVLPKPASGSLIKSFITNALLRQELY